MKIIITIQHPAHVHFFRNTILELKSEGHEIHVFARDKDITIELLDHYGIAHSVLAGDGSSLLETALVQTRYEYRILKRARQIKPDVMTAIAEPAVSHVASLLGARSVVFSDTEHATLSNRLAFPFADVVCTPACFSTHVGDNHVKYDSYHEFAYLHPNRFDPDPEILDDMGLDRNEQFVILRTVSWDAVHDVGDQGFTDLDAVVEQLESTGASVIITSEDDLPTALEPYQAKVPAHQMHDLMAFADLFIGESATMATESAVLGTPGLLISTSRRCYTDELETKYGMVETFSNGKRQQDALHRAVDILEEENQEKWESLRNQIMNDKCDTTNVILNKIT